jgi:hypothetical protein
VVFVLIFHVQSYQISSQMMDLNVPKDIIWRICDHAKSLGQKHGYRFNVANGNLTLVALVHTDLQHIMSNWTCWVIDKAMFKIVLGHFL